jgi:nucleoside-diphosphate-sugar epimerase
MALHLVTGGAGYFGECLVRSLIKKGEDVRVFDLNRLENVNGIEQSIIGDIRNIDDIDKACHGVDYVHHNVAQVPLAKNNRLFWEVNRDGTRNLLNSALNNSVKKVVYTSSSAIFGVPRNNPVNEETRPSPIEEYGEAKLEGEMICHEYSKKGLDVSIIRPRTVVGHGRLGIFQILFEWVYQGNNIPVLDGGNNIYQFVHADDLSEASILAINSASNGTYNIGAEEFCSMRETLEGLVKHADTGSKVKSLPMWPLKKAMQITSLLGLSPLGPYHASLYGKSLYFDISKAKEELGYKPIYSNISMVCDSYDWYCKNRGEVLNSERGSFHRSALKQGALNLVKYIV